MKIRNGFVSNSSSSSFVIVVTEESYEKATKGLDETAKAILKLWVKHGVIGKEKVVYAGYISDRGGNNNLFSQDINGDLDQFAEYVDKKWDGDSSAIFYSGFVDKVPKEERIEIHSDI